MVNLRLAEILTNMAEIKKSGPDNKNVVISIMKAARTIRDNPVSIEKIYQSGKLKEFIGVEEQTYKLIEEYLETGRIGIYEEIK